MAEVSKDMTIGEILRVDMNIAPILMSRSWDEKTSQNYAELNDENGYWQIWLEDEESIAAKMKAVRDSGAAGVAEWRLGDEKSGIWPVIAEYLQ